MSDTTPAKYEASKVALLAAPFAASEIKWKPSVVSGNRALAMAYVDARVIQDRLDEVLGVENWQDDYELLPGGEVICRLKIRLGGEWLTKVDVGGQSEQKDEGDRMKAAFSDALKRAAVKFGVGRFLYRLPAQWVDYDPAKKQFVRTPTLPDLARPAAAKAPATKAVPAAMPDKTTLPKKMGIDWSGGKLSRDLQTREAELIGAGLCKKDQLLTLIDEFGADRGFPDSIEAWSEKQVKDARLFLAEKTAEMEAAAAGKGGA